MKLLRSMLFVPGDSEKKLAKGVSTQADALILDLEDSVAIDRLPTARGMVCDYLKQHPRGAQQTWVRINPLHTELALHDLTAVMPGRPDGIVLVTNVALSFFPAEATAIGGLTMGADPVAYGIAAVAATRAINLRSFSVRKESKDHGVTGRIAGALQPGDKVIITEDTVTRGTSLFEAVDAVRAFGAEVVLITVIVDGGVTCAALAADAGFLYKLVVPRWVGSAKRG
jgi:orotate phosphoribosyltransferase